MGAVGDVNVVGATEYRHDSDGAQSIAVSSFDAINVLSASVLPCGNICENTVVYC